MSWKGPTSIRESNSCSVFLVGLVVGCFGVGLVFLEGQSKNKAEDISSRMTIVSQAEGVCIVF